MHGTGTPSMSRDRLGAVLRALIGLTASCAFGTLLLAVVPRAGFPWPLEWMESASAQHALRLSRGLPVYAAPSADFIPFLYPPLAYVPMALSLALFGATLPAARLASIACSALTLVLIERSATRALGDRVAGVAAAALFAVGFGYTGAFFDLARVDACFVVLVVAAVERLGARRPHAALGWLVLAVFTKQHGLLLLLALTCALVLEDPRQHARALAAAWSAVLTAFGALQWTTSGWFARYTLALPAGQPLQWPLLASFFAVDLLAYLPVLSLCAGLDLARRWRARELEPSDALLAAALCASALGRAHAGGFDNVRLPAFALLCVAGTVPLCRVLVAKERGARSRVLAFAALAVQGVMLWQSPALHVPSGASGERFAALRSALAECAAGGRAVALDYAWLDAPFAHTMALSDVRLGADRALARDATAAVLDGLRAPDAPDALAIGEHFPALDRVVLARYRECARVPAPQLATGFQPGAGRPREQVIFTRVPAPGASHAEQRDDP
jgi:hypothetical protein